MEKTLEAWRVLETYVPHSISRLGVSNVRLDIWKVLCGPDIRVPPSVVQNRFCRDVVPPSHIPDLFTPTDPYDAAVRAYCKDDGIVYQAWAIQAGNKGVAGGRDG